MMKRGLITACALLVLGAREAAAQRSSPDRSRIDTVVSLERRGTVDLSLVSGRISVRGWDRQDVKISASVDRGYLKFDAARSRIRLEVEHRSGRVGAALYELSVPRGTRVLLNSVSGDLFADGSRGQVNASSVSGRITISEAHGGVTVESVSGSLRLTRVQGDLGAESVSGRIDVADVAGNIDAETVSGQITISSARSRQIDASSVSGRIDYGGAVDPAGRYEFESHSGSIRIAIPPGASARLSAETFSGSIRSEFPATTRSPEGDRHSPNSIDMQLGAGRARVTAETFSGSIHIIRGTDRDPEE